MDEPFLLLDVLSAEFNVSIVESKEEMLQLLNEKSFQLIIMSDKYILYSNTYGCKNIRDHAVLYDIPIIVYSKTEDVNLLIKLYSLDIKGHIEPTISKEVLLSTINDVLNRSNPYIGTPRDKFIKAFIRYEEARNSISNVLYLTNYLIGYYKVDKEKAEDIRASVIFLIIALKKSRPDKVFRFVHDMSLSPYLERVMKNYKNPLSLDDHIILASLVFEGGDSGNKYKIDASVIDNEIAAVAKEAVQKSKIFISSSHNIYNFWERLDEALNRDSKITVENYQLYLHYIFEILYKALVKYGVLQAEFDNSCDNVFKVIIIPKGCTDTMMEECIAAFVVNDKNVTFEKIMVNSQIALLIKLNKVSKEVFVPIKAEKIIDSSKLNSMHYKDESKISAVVFLEDFNVDNYLLDDLADNEREAKSALYFKEDLTEEMVEAVAGISTKYAQLLNQTIEFEDLAYSVSALARVISTITLESLDESTKKLLKLYIIGIIDDLSSWRKHIFVLQDTPDIHYLDASLLDNCAEIEAVINPQTKVNQDEDDSLDFF